MQPPLQFSLAAGAFQLGKSFTWVNGAPDDPAQGVPGSVIKPVVEFVEALLGQEAGGAVVEIPVRVTRCHSTVGAAPVSPVSLNSPKAQLQRFIPPPRGPNSALTKVTVSPGSDSISNKLGTLTKIVPGALSPAVPRSGITTPQEKSNGR